MSAGRLALMRPARPARPSTPGPDRHRLILAICGGLLVVLVSFWQTTADLRVSRFHPDESRWIDRAQHLAELGDPLGSYWADRYLIRGQPPMGSYITGLGLALQGFDFESSDPWNFSFGNESDINWNVTYGNMPSEDYLIAARRTTVVIGALSCLTVFMIVTLLSNWLGGTIAGLFMAVHPLNVYLSTIAVSDAAFTLVVALSVLAAIWLARGPTWSRTILLGITFGIGTSLKLSPIFVAVGLAIVGLLLLASPLAARVRPLHWFWDRMGAYEPSARRLGWMLIALPLIAVTFFVASYPYLWSDPIGRTQVLIDFRRDEMRNQSRIWGDAAIGSQAEALSRTWTMLEERYSASGKFLVKFGITEPRPGHENGAEPGFDLPFALAGTVIFAVLAFRRGFRSPMFLAFLILAGQSLIILIGLNVDFDRYYLPLVMGLAVGLGIGAGQAAGWLLRVLERSPRAVRARQKVRAGPIRAN